MPNFLLSKALLVSTTQLTMILIATAAIFIVLIVIAVIKTYKLNAENKRLMNTNAFREAEDSPKHISSGHLYENNNK